MCKLMAENYIVNKFIHEHNQVHVFDRGNMIYIDIYNPNQDGQWNKKKWKS